MKQTAVEWFFDKLKNHEIQAEHFELFRQAKEMEKEQTDKAYYDGVNDERKNTLRYKYFKYKKSIEEQTK